MGVIVYCITGKKKYILITFFKKYNSTGPKLRADRYQMKGKKTDESNRF
jgi:hypothetical protein